MNTDNKKTETEQCTIPSVMPRYILIQKGNCLSVYDGKNKTNVEHRSGTWHKGHLIMKEDDSRYLIKLCSKLNEA